MKRKSIVMMGAAFLALGLASCGKTSKGKFVNDWNITSDVESGVETSSNGSKSDYFTSYENGVYKYDYKYTNSGGQVDFQNNVTGAVHEYSYSIKKDGTFEAVLNRNEVINSNKKIEYKLTQTGTWSFAKKTKSEDYGKNERVVFDVLNVNRVETVYNNGVADVPEHSSFTYAPGNYSYVYSVESSTSNEMVLKSVFDRMSQDDNGTWNKYLGTRTLTFKKK